MWLAPSNKQRKKKGETEASPSSQHWLGGRIVHSATVVRDRCHLGTGNAPVHNLEIRLGLDAVVRRHRLPFERDHGHDTGAHAASVADGILEIINRAAPTGRRRAEGECHTAM